MRQRQRTETSLSFLEFSKSPYTITLIFFRKIYVFPGDELLAFCLIRAFALSIRIGSFRSFYCFTKHSFRQFWPLAVFKDYFSCFRGLEKAGVSEQTNCGSKCLFADHRAFQAEPAELTIQVNAASISFPYL